MSNRPMPHYARMELTREIDLTIGRVNKMTGRTFKVNREIYPHQPTLIETHAHGGYSTIYAANTNQDLFSYLRGLMEGIEMYKAHAPKESM